MTPPKEMSGTSDVLDCRSDPGVHLIQSNRKTIVYPAQLKVEVNNPPDFADDVVGIGKDSLTVYRDAETLDKQLGKEVGDVYTAMKRAEIAAKVEGKEEVEV